jgi:exonuclease III
VREAFARLTGHGWTDAIRALHPSEGTNTKSH